MTNIVNNYANQDLYIAAPFHERLREFVSRAEQDSLTFSRQVDGWWAAIAIGVRRGQRAPLPPPPGLVKFNDGGILSSDPWRITHLELLALSEGGPDMLLRPNEVIRMASEYAHTGFPELLEMIVGQPEPTLALLLRLAENSGDQEKQGD